MRAFSPVLEKTCFSQPHRKIVFKIVIFLVLLIGLIIVGEIIYFHQILSNNVSSETSELIVVFAGGAKRTETGYALANSGYAPCLVISPADQEALKVYDRKHRRPSTVRCIVEDKARTTFENAVYTRKIIAEHGFKSVLLVTSSYHLPRSYFLLKVLLLGNNVKIRAFGVTGGTGKNDLRSWRGKKIIYNEMVKLWGSTGELLIYKIRGCLPEENPKQIAFLKYMKSLFLFFH
ncbi:YdcF family protein [Desulfobacterales bacterium HSG2]|nr:YdcF family protein [Desulfobacterales bacterium HSG2]